MKLLLLCVLALPAFATITENSKTVTNDSFHIRYTKTSTSCVAIQYGPSTGSYTGLSAPECNTSTTGAIGVGGLAASTTFYYRINRYAVGADWSTGTIAESTVEATLTTSADPSPYPATPTLPVTEYVPTEPSSGSYTVVPMARDAMDGICKATANKTDPGNWRAGNISIGYTLEQVLATVSGAVIIRYASGTVCDIYKHSPTEKWHAQMPLFTDDGTWLIFETEDLTGHDFPPFGSRISSRFATAATMKIMDAASINGSAAGDGQWLQAYDSAVHHIWIRNIACTNSMVPYSDTTVIDPQSVFSPCVTVNPVSQAPHHIVLDRFYIHEAGWPSRWTAGLWLGGDYAATVGTAIDIDFWRPGLYPTSNNRAVVVGSQIQVPAMSWSLNPVSKATYSATATNITASGSGSMTCWMPPSGATNNIRCEYAGVTSPACSSSGCTMAAGAQSTPTNSLKIFIATWTSGTPTVTYTQDGLDQISNYQAALAHPQGIYILQGDHKSFLNTYIHGPGQGIYNDAIGSGVSFADHVFRHLTLHTPLSEMQGNAAWDGYERVSRDAFETKQADKWLFEGNLVLGGQSTPGRNAGFVIDIAGSYDGNGANDLTFRNSKFTDIPAFFQCAGGGTNGPPDSPQSRRILVTNNLVLNFDRDTHQTNYGTSLVVPLIQVTPGCSQTQFTYNTIPTQKGFGSALLRFGGNDYYASPAQAGFAFKNNLAAFTHRSSAPLFNCSPPVSVVLPAFDCSGSDASGLNSVFRRWNGTTSTPSWDISGNYFLPAYESAVSAFTANPVTYTDMTDANGTTYLTSVAGTNTQVTGAAQTLASRLTQVGYNSTTGVSNNCGGCGITGSLDAAMGVVTNIAVTPSSSVGSFTYTAPDTRACTLDVSTNSFSSWTRFTDAGGGTSRTLSATSLAPSTTYSYELLCYFPQTTALGFSGTSLTSGTFTTASGLTSRTQGKKTTSGKMQH